MGYVVNLPHLTNILFVDNFYNSSLQLILDDGIICFKINVVESSLIDGNSSQNYPVEFRAILPGKVYFVAPVLECDRTFEFVMY
jgi:hypothetical protein